MIRIAHLDPVTTTGPAKSLFDGVKAKLGVVPNLHRVLGNAPAALRGYLSFGAALAEGTFDAKLREQIALAIAESNQCGYCLSAHTDAILKIARSMVVQRGELGAADLQRARAAGLTDGDLIEAVAHVALNIFSNYVNHIAGTIVDFPEVKPGNGYVVPSCNCA